MLMKFFRKIDFQSLFIETIIVVFTFIVGIGILYVNLSNTSLSFTFSSQNVEAIAAIFTVLLLFWTFSLQREVSKQQSFENTFFQLLRTHSEIVNAIDLRRDGKKQEVIAKGRDCFRIFKNNFYEEILSLARKKDDNHIEPIYRSERIFTAKVALKSADIDLTSEAYENIFEKHQADLGHYFRHLYHIIKYVHESDTQDKKRYVGFARATLSSYELALLFYNGLSDNASKKFKPLIEDYALLKNMDMNLIFNLKHLEKYKESAYGEDLDIRLAVIYYNKGEKNEFGMKIDHYTNAIKHNSKFADAYYERGLAYQEINPPDNEKAQADFNKAKSLDPEKYGHLK